MKFYKNNVIRKGARGGIARKAILTILLFACLLCLLFACNQADKYKVNFAELTGDFKTEYYVGEAFCPGGYLKAYFELDNYDAIPITEDMLINFDTSHAGDIIVTVAYKDYSTTVPIHVKPLTVRSLTVDAGTLPSAIFKGDAFPSGVTLTAVMSDGSTRSGIPVTAAMLGGFDSSHVGAQTVTVSYQGTSISISLKIKEDAPAAITLVGAKQTYAVGEALDLEGARLDVIFESGLVETVTPTDPMFSGFDTSRGGEHTATVTYAKKTFEYRYFVQKAAVSFLVKKQTLPVLFEKGDPFPTGAEGVLTYDDESVETVLLTKENVPDFTTASAGDKRVEICFGDYTDYYEYTVLPAVLNATVYGFTPAVRQNGDFDGFGELIVQYEGDEGASEWSESIPLFDPAATVQVSDLEEGGGKLQRITTDRLVVEYCTTTVGDVFQKVLFRSREIEFGVHVYSEEESDTAVESLSLAGLFPSIVCGEGVDPTGVQVTIYYKYKESITVACEASWVKVALPQEVTGDYVDLTASVELLGVTAEETRTIRVLSPDYAQKVTSIAVFGLPTFYLTNDDLTLDNATISAVLGGGYRIEEVAVIPAYIEGFDTATAGEKQMTVTYGGISKTVEYRVITPEQADTVTDLSLYHFDPLLFVGDTTDAIDRDRELTLILGNGYGQREISLSDEGVTLTGGPFTEAGEAQVTVSYEGVARSVTVRVHPAEDKEKLTSISVPQSVVAEVGTDPDFSAFSLVLTYGYGYEEREIPLSSEGVSIEAFSNDKEGFVTVSVTYSGLSCTATLSFVAGMSDNVLQRLELAPNARRSFEVDDALSDVALIAVYKYKRVTVEVTTEMAVGFSTTEEGTFDLILSYGGKTVLYTYSVSEKTNQTDTAGSETPTDENADQGSETQGENQTQDENESELQ